MCIDTAESSTEQMSYPLEKAGHRIQGVRFVSVYESSRGSGLGDTGRWGQSRHRMPPEGPGCPSKVGGVITLPSSDRGKEGEEKVRRPRGERSRENVCEGSHRNIQISTGQGAASLEETRAGDARKMEFPIRASPESQENGGRVPKVPNHGWWSWNPGKHVEEVGSRWKGRNHPSGTGYDTHRMRYQSQERESNSCSIPQRGKRQSRRNT